MADPRMGEFCERVAWIDLELAQIDRAAKEFRKTQKEQRDALLTKRAALLERIESGQMTLEEAK
jgi:hypothetical protein